MGNITNITDNSFTGTGKRVSYTYDSIYRLRIASTTVASSTSYRHTFAYSPIGNITAMATSGASTTYTYAETSYTNPHAPTQIGGASLTYDNNGNVTQYGPVTYTWDYRNRMTATAQGGATTTYTYDHTYERVSKVTASGTTYYANDLYSNEGATSTRFIFDTAGTLLATVEGNGTATSTKYYHQDHLGGTNMITNSSGVVVQAIDYYPYGGKRITVGSGVSSRQYIGEHFDSTSNLNYLNARYYDGGRGQFLSQDPVFWWETQNLSNPQSLNSYSYAENNPINKEDPTGLKTSSKAQVNRQIQALQKKVISLLKQQIEVITRDLARSTKNAAIDPIQGIKTATNKSESLPSRTGATIGTGIGIVSGIVVPESRGAQGAKVFFQEAKYTQKVLDQSKKLEDVYHSFSPAVDKYAAKFGEYSQELGDDTVNMYEHVRLEGSLILQKAGDTTGKAVDGVFHFIKNTTGEINHRLFEPY